MLYKVYVNESSVYSTLLCVVVILEMFECKALLVVVKQKTAYEI